MAHGLSQHAFHCSAMIPRKTFASAIGYDKAMSTFDTGALVLPRAFEMLELRPKSIPAFFPGDCPGQNSMRARAKVNWTVIDYAAVALPPTDLLQQLPELKLTKILNGARNRPKFQSVYEAADDARSPRYGDCPLPCVDVRALMFAIRHVRNNIFHSNK